MTECYKCGATLAPTANKWVYVGSHSGRGETVSMHEVYIRLALNERYPLIFLVGGALKL